MVASGSTLEYCVQEFRVTVLFRGKCLERSDDLCVVFERCTEDGGERYEDSAS